MNILTNLMELLIAMATEDVLSQEVPQTLSSFNGHTDAMKLGMWTFTWDDGVSRVAHYQCLSTKNYVNHLFELVSDHKLAKIGEYINSKY